MSPVEVTAARSVRSLSYLTPTIVMNTFGPSFIHRNGLRATGRHRSPNREVVVIGSALFSVGGRVAWDVLPDVSGEA